MFTFAMIAIGIIGTVQMARVLWIATTPEPTRFRVQERVWLRDGDRVHSATVLSRHWSPQRGYVVSYYEGVADVRQFLSSRKAHRILLPRG